MLREICHWLSFYLFIERACVRIVYFLLMLMFACTKRKRELLHFQVYMPSRWHSFILLTFILLRVDQRVRKGSVTYVQEARYLKRGMLRLIATCGPKSQGAPSRYSALATLGEVPSLGPAYFPWSIRIRCLGPLSRALMFSATCDTAVRFASDGTDLATNIKLQNPLEETFSYEKLWRFPQN